MARHEFGNISLFKLVLNYESWNIHGNLKNFQVTNRITKLLSRRREGKFPDRCLRFPSAFPLLIG